MKRITKLISICLLNLMLLSGCDLILPNIDISSSGNVNLESSKSEKEEIENGKKEDSEVNNNDNVSHKYSLDDIGNYVIDIANAKSLGIKKISRKSSNKKAKNENTENINVIVKEENEIVSNDVIVRDDGTIEVKFININTKNKLQDIKEEMYVVARTENKERVNIISMDKELVIQSSDEYEYRVLVDGEVYADWKKSEYDTISFDIKSLSEEQKQTITIESRSLDASIIIPIYSEFNYKIYDQSKTLVKEYTAPKVVGDNENYVLYGFVEGETYLVEYSGKGIITEIEQSELDAQVDKLCVVGEFTFISFIPSSYTPGISRTNDEYLNLDVEIDTEGDYVYDKIGYYDSVDRRSFVIHNNSGLIYPLNGVKINRIHNGLFEIEGSKIIHDIKLNDNNEIEFFPLYANDTIRVFDYMKDKYNNCYIINHQMNTYYKATNTNFVKLTWTTNYYLSDNREVIYTTGTFNSIDNIYYFDQNREMIEVSPFDTFRVMANNCTDVTYESQSYGNSMRPYLIKNGLAYCCDFPKIDSNYYGGKWTSGFNFRVIIIFDIISKNKKSLITDGLVYGTQFLEKYGIVLGYDEDSGMIAALYGLHDVEVTNFNEVRLKNVNDLYSEFSNSYKIDTLITNCMMTERTDKEEIITYGVEGNLYWELFVEMSNDEYKIVPHVKGTYFPDNVGSIVLKPINNK